MRDALHQAAVAEEDVGVMIDDLVARPVELRAPAVFSASAMPTALARPWPSGPVVVSTPGAMPCSGWPARLRAELAEVAAAPRSAGRSRSGAAASRAASSRGRWTARSGRGRPSAGFAGLCCRKSLHSTSAMSAMPIGMPGWPELARCTASMLSARMALASSRRVGIIGAPAGKSRIVHDRGRTRGNAACAGPAVRSRIRYNCAFATLADGHD